MSDQAEVWRLLAQMPYKGVSGGRGRVIRQNGKDMSVQVIRHSPDGKMFSGRFRAVKYSDLPSKINQNEEANELKLNQGEGLEYCFHFTWWDMTHHRQLPTVAHAAPAGILLAEYNHYAPRATALTPYTLQLFDRACYLKVVPIISKDVRQQVEGSRGVSALEVGCMLDDNEMRRSKRRRGRGPGSMFGRQAPSNTARVTVKFHPKPRGSFTPDEIWEEAMEWKGKN